MSVSRIYLSTSIIVLILVLIHPVNAFEAEDVVYSQIESVHYEKRDYIENMTYFDFTIKGQIFNTLEENVTIITSNTNLYSFYIETNLLQETKGGFYPWDVWPALTEHTIQLGVQNYSVALTLF